MNSEGAAILRTVMEMNDSKDMLTSLLKIAQMGQVGIRSVLETAMGPGLRKELESQLREYDAIETEAHHIAFQRGWELRELDPAVRFVTDRVTRAKLKLGNTDSAIAGMMIRGNTKGMITGLKDVHRFNGQDQQVSMLSRKLLDCERANIRQMQGFL